MAINASVRTALLWELVTGMWLTLIMIGAAAFLCFVYGGVNLIV